MKIIKKISDHTDRNSLAAYFRRKRFQLFYELFLTLKQPVRILDVGGTAEYWKNFNLIKKNDARITLLNLYKIEVQASELNFVEGDVRDMRRFKDSEFDVVFSNSVIEHLDNFEDQRKAANEIRRVGKRYFIQTPNYYFPIEPHFVFPLFHFLPKALKIFLVMHFKLGMFPKQANRENAEKTIKSIRLLRRVELEELFPNATIYEEKILSLTKSFVVYKWA